MKINSVPVLWHENFFEALGKRSISFRRVDRGGFDLIQVDTYPLVVHLVDLKSSLSYVAEDFIRLQEAHQEEGIYLVHLWEDVWHTRAAQVMARISSILGLNKKIHGRQCTIVAITQREANVFLDQHHLQYGVKAKYRFGLMKSGQLVAVALFSGGRPMPRISASYLSYELVRFASISGYTVSGGFTKLLRHFSLSYHPDDIMSYADRDWSLGNAYARSGFNLIEVTAAIPMWVDPVNSTRYFVHRLPNADVSEFQPVFNTGNLKYKLYLNGR